MQTESKTMRPTLGHHRSRLLLKVGKILRNVGTQLIDQHSPTKRIWIDVGAHLGENMLDEARIDPALTIFAFEPNWELVRQIVGVLPNYIVIPMAVAERDGFSEFFLNADDMTSSLLEFDVDGLQRWNGADGLRLESKVVVPTIRLDTFMDRLNIQTVSFLKVDAQGADLSVIRSAGARLGDMQKIALEVDINPVRLYRRSAGRNEVAEYMEEHGFVLKGSEVQSRGQEENLIFVPKSTPE